MPQNNMNFIEKFKNEIDANIKVENKIIIVDMSLTHLECKKIFDYLCIENIIVHFIK